MSYNLSILFFLPFTVQSGCKAYKTRSVSHEHVNKYRIFVVLPRSLNEQLFVEKEFCMQVVGLISSVLKMVTFLIMGFLINILCLLEIIGIAATAFAWKSIGTAGFEPTTTESEGGVAPA